jgi:MFS superfamily sulfate permease-like transporter
MPTLAFSFDCVQQLQAPAFPIAMLRAMESLRCAAIADSFAGTKYSSNQELTGHDMDKMLSTMCRGTIATLTGP